MFAWPLWVIGAGVSAGLFVSRREQERRARAREQLVADSLDDPAARRRLIDRLEIDVALMARDWRHSSFGNFELARAQAALARLYAKEDGTDDLLLEMHRAANLPPPSARAVRLDALVRHRRWDQAERALAGGPPRRHERAVWERARAELRLARGDAEGALALVAGKDEPEHELLRLRALAAMDRDGDEVWRRFAALPPETLHQLVRRHGDEPAAHLARRILDGAAYR